MSRTTIFAALGILAILVWLFIGNPESSESHFIKCPLHLITGFQCPFCGTQRAIHHLLHLRLGRAFMCNPWLLPVSFYAAAYATGRWRSTKAMLTMLLLTLAWGVARNVI